MAGDLDLLAGCVDHDARNVFGFLGLGGLYEIGVFNFFGRMARHLPPDKKRPPLFWGGVHQLGLNMIRALSAESGYKKSSWQPHGFLLGCTRARKEINSTLSKSQVENERGPPSPPPGEPPVRRVCRFWAAASRGPKEEGRRWILARACGRTGLGNLIRRSLESLGAFA